MRLEVLVAPVAHHTRIGLFAAAEEHPLALGRVELDGLELGSFV